MSWDNTANSEIVRRIKSISKEESDLTYKAGQLRAELRALESKREELATKRRQYEYALKTLDGEDVTRVVIETHPVPGGHIVKVNQHT